MPPTINAALRTGQALAAQQNAIATAFNPGVTPPDHWQLNYYTFHRRLGQNVRCAPLLLGLIDDVTQDMTNPSNEYIKAKGPELWDVLSPNFHFTGTANSTFPALDAPPAPSGPGWQPSGNPSSPPVGTIPESSFPTNPGFPPPASSFPDNPPFPRELAKYTESIL